MVLLQLLSGLTWPLLLGSKCISSMLLFKGMSHTHFLITEWAKDHLAKNMSYDMNHIENAFAKNVFQLGFVSVN